MTISAQFIDGESLTAYATAHVTPMIAVANVPNMTASLVGLDWEAESSVWLGLVVMFRRKPCASDGDLCDSTWRRHWGRIPLVARLMVESGDVVAKNALYCCDRCFALKEWRLLTWRSLMDCGFLP